jgi:uncharacterized protein HemX
MMWAVARDPSVLGMATTVPDPAQQPQAAAPKQSHPWHWIVPCLLLLVIAAGLLIWGLGVNSDLNDQKAKNEQLSKQAAATQSDVQTVSDQVNQISDSLKSAGDQISQGTAEAQANAKAAIDSIQSKFQDLGTRLSDAKKKLSDAIDNAKNGGGGGGG